jgi:hypothetical protein
LGQDGFLVSLKASLVVRWFDVHTATIAIKFHISVHERPDCVIATEADIATGLEFGSALAENDVSGNDGFTAEFFNAETLADAVASVFNTTLSFFMGHEILFCGDCFDFKAGQLATVADCAVIAFTAAEFESDNFVILELIDDFGANLGACYERFADFDIAALADKKHVREIDVRADFGFEFFDVDFVSGLDSILFATCLNHCVCHKKTLLNRVGDLRGE